MAYVYRDSTGILFRAVYSIRNVRVRVDGLRLQRRCFRTLACGVSDLGLREHSFEAWNMFLSKAPFRYRTWMYSSGVHLPLGSLVDVCLGLRAQNICEPNLSGKPELRRFKPLHLKLYIVRCQGLSRHHILRHV